MFEPRADDLGLDAGVIHLQQGLCQQHGRDKLQGKSSAPQAFRCYPPSSKYSADAIYFGESLSYMAERFLVRAIIIELKWSLEADTLPQWSRSADPVLDGSKNFEMKAGCQKNCMIERR